MVFGKKSAFVPLSLKVIGCALLLQSLCFIAASQARQSSNGQDRAEQIEGEEDLTLTDAPNVPPRARFSPRFFAEFNYASGDHNPTDGTRGTFDQLYATAHDKYGTADQVGWKNIEHLRGAVEFKLNKNWQASLKHNAWWLADPHDALYNFAGNIVARVSSGAAGRYVGQEIDLQTTYTFPHKIQAGGGFGHIYPGTFLLRATPGVSYNFPYSMLTYTF